MKKVLLFAALMSLLFAESALAQGEKVSVAQRGTDSITLGVNYNDFTIGYWRKLSGSTDIGVDFGARYRGEEHQDIQNYQLTPAIRHFLMPDNAVSPYLYAGLTASYGNNDYDGDNYKSNSESYTAGALAGIGLQWFPISHMSIGGHVGARAEYFKNRYSNTNFTTTTTGNGMLIPFTTKSRYEGFTVGTFNSGIELNLFF